MHGVNNPVTHFANKRLNCLEVAKQCADQLATAETHGKNPINQNYYHRSIFYKPEQVHCSHSYEYLIQYHHFMRMLSLQMDGHLYLIVFKNATDFLVLAFLRSLYAYFHSRNFMAPVVIARCEVVCYLMPHSNINYLYDLSRLYPQHPVLSRRKYLTKTCIAYLKL